MRAVVQALLAGEILDSLDLELGLGVEVLQVVSLDTSSWLFRCSELPLLLHLVDVLEWVAGFSTRQIVHSAYLDVVDLVRLDITQLQNTLQLALLALVAFVSGGHRPSKDTSIPTALIQ